MLGDEMYCAKVKEDETEILEKAAYDARALYTSALFACAMTGVFVLAVGDVNPIETFV